MSRHGFVFGWPDVAAGEKDNVASGGQALAVPAGTRQVALLATSVNSASTDQALYVYSDGSSRPVALAVSYWRDAQPMGDNELVARVATYRAASRSGSGSLFYVPLSAPDSSKQLAAVVLPTNADVHIFALAIQ